MLVPAPARADDATACDEAGTAIVVETATRTLHLCERGASVASFPVAIGGNGTGKEKEGDGKTPLGTYRLGAPRASSDYGTFIPIGFPTAAQKRRGVTGGAIGIHGPDRRLQALGRVAVALGWTRGCIALSSDVEMRSIVRWMGRRSLSIEIQ
jgi:murein L,D-transpeptidase YafK